MKVLLTGATGFFGSHIEQVLQNRYTLFCVGSKDYNFLDYNQTNQMFIDLQPDVIIYASGKSGGILQNKNEPATFWYENLMMATHIWELSRKYNVKKIVSIIPGCCYPKNAPSPMKEESIWDGYPDHAPSFGALSKKMGLVASYAYKQQFGIKSNIVIPANMYGENDCFHQEKSHVIPALMMKMHKAKEDKLEEITLWGSGVAIRDFIYVGDVAKTIPYFIDNDLDFESELHLRNICNVSSGTGTTIKELAETIMEVVGYKGKLNWDITKPEGPLNKVFDNSRMKSLDLSCETSLRSGLQKTYDWYKINKVGKSSL